MSKPTIQDIFLRFYPRYLDKYTPSPQQSKVANCIINGKTGAYGANVSMGNIRQACLNSTENDVTVFTVGTGAGGEADEV